MIDFTDDTDYSVIFRCVCPHYPLSEKDLSILSIQVKGNESWAQYTVPLLESLCDLGLLQSARDFREPGALTADWPKVLEDAVACPKGCRNGVCGSEGCVCYPGFRGPECEKTTGELTVLGIILSLFPFWSQS